MSNEMMIWLIIVTMFILAVVAFIVSVRWSHKKIAKEMIGEIRQNSQLIISKMRTEMQKDNDKFR